MPVAMKPVSFSSSFNPSVPSKTFRAPICSSLCNLKLRKNPNRGLFRKQNFVFAGNHSIWRASRISFCYPENISEDLMNNQPPNNSQIGELPDTEELELLDKPLPIPVNGAADTKLEGDPKKLDKDEALEPFLKFFKSNESEEELAEQDEVGQKIESQKKVVEYYDPKPGDFVVGVVVSGNENKLDVNVGADLLGTMLTKEVLPLYDKEMDYLLCDLDKNAEEYMANGKMGIVRNEYAVNEKPISGRPIVDAGTVLFAEVLGRTLSGRPLLSTRRFFRRIAWHRVRQVLSSLSSILNHPAISCLGTSDNFLSYLSIQLHAVESS